MIKMCEHGATGACMLCFAQAMMVANRAKNAQLPTTPPYNFNPGPIRNVCPEGVDPDVFASAVAADQATGERMQYLRRDFASNNGTRFRPDGDDQ